MSQKQAAARKRAMKNREKPVSGLKKGTLFVMLLRFWENNKGD